MLSQIDRQFVQMMREARSIKITINIGASDQLTFLFPVKGRHGDYRKLRHDIALAAQEYYNQNGPSED